MRLCNFTITALDEYNFALYEEKEKGKFRGKETKGVKQQLIGYYGTLGGALNALLKQHFISRIDKDTAESLLSGLTALETKINEQFGHIKTKDIQDETI